MSGTLLKQKAVKCRKRHVCQGCGKEIAVGEIVMTTTVVGVDGIWTYRECDQCHAFWEKECCVCSNIEYCIGENYSVGSFLECRGV